MIFCGASSIATNRQDGAGGGESRKKGTPLTDSSYKKKRVDTMVF